MFIFLPRFDLNGNSCVHPHSEIIGLAASGHDFSKILVLPTVFINVGDLKSSFKLLGTHKGVADIHNLVPSFQFTCTIHDIGTLRPRD